MLAVRASYQFFSATWIWHQASLRVPQKMQEHDVVDQYDSPWKDAIERYFPDFMRFFFPDAYADIDWSKPFDFLEQELRAVVRDAELGTRVVDKLVRVSLNDGSAEWVYIHLEVQCIESFEEEKSMRYVTSIERLAKEEGMQQGIQQGMQRGRIVGKMQILRRLIQRRFGPMPEWAESRLTSASESDLEAWTIAVLDAGSIEVLLSRPVPIQSSPN